MRLLVWPLLLTAVATAEPPHLVTIAGTDWRFPTDTILATDAPLGKVAGVTMDAAGNLYVSDQENYIVAKISPGGLLSVVAGTGQPGFSGQGGPATQVSLLSPYGVAVDQAGNLYISDMEWIRRVTPDGTMTTVAGNGTLAASGDNGPALHAGIWVEGIALDSAGNLYLADWGNHRVRKVTPDGTISTVAGNGKTGYFGDGGPATEATLYFPSDVAVDGSGNLYIADNGNARVRKVTPDGLISTVAGGGYNMPDQVPALTAFLLPLGIAVDASGNIYVSSTLEDELCRIGTDGTVSMLVASRPGSPLGDGGPARLASLYGATGVAVDSGGGVYVADSEHRRVRRVDPQGTIGTLAGNGRYSFDGDGGPATAAALSEPDGLAVDGAGNIYFAEGEVRVRRVDGAGVIVTVAGSEKGYWGDEGSATAAAFDRPTGPALDALGNLYVADAFNNRIRRVSPDGIVHTIAGGGRNQNDGPASSASIQVYDGLALDRAGNVYFAERFSHRVRRLSAAGMVETIAGSGGHGFAGDGEPAIQALLATPEAIAIDAAGNVFFFDSKNWRIRKIGTDGVITTVAGNGKRGSSGDGGAATDASLDAVQGLVMDQAGNLYVSDGFNYRIRVVSADGVINTVIATSPDLPGALAIGPDGVLYMACEYGQKIKAIVP